MEFIKAHQLNIMLFMSGICFVLAIMTLMTSALSVRRRRIIALLEIAAMLLLLADRYAYLYRGDPSALGFWMVRISNFLVYFMTLYISHSLTLYLYDLLSNEGGMTAFPRRIWICEALFAIGLALLILSQFTGLYYTFDARNTYQRAPANLVCYAVPFLITFLQLSVIIQYRKLLRPAIVVPLCLNTLVPLAASIIQIFTYGVSLTNMTVVGMAIILYIYVVTDLSKTAEHAKNLEIEFYQQEKEKEHNMFEQTAEALASAVDAKDRYTNGHSRRVAEYSRKIAEEAGKSEEECEKVYFSALLHDVGKIGVPISILTKKGRLTDEEFEQIKQHPVVSGQILSRIQQSPWLAVGARYHHERYDGRGYPEGLKGEQIPEISRIIAVADAYDAMTSNRSYRSAIPQHIVREELVKGAGTQFDPEYARIMIHLVDQDTHYHMQEIDPGAGGAPTTGLRCESIYNDCTEGIAVTGKPVRISLCSQPDQGLPENACLPTLILFDALDGKVHPGEEQNKDLLYFEYARIRVDGEVTERGTRKVEVAVSEEGTAIDRPIFGEPIDEQRYEVEAVRYKDHALVQITYENRKVRVTLALPDSTRFTYLSIGGEHCDIHNIRIETEETEIVPDAITRIAEEISFIRDCPEGDVPNLQVDGCRTDATAGIPITGGMKLTFHTMSLPTARLVWHCPYLSLFSSDDGRVNGEGFREYLLLRLDGECGESDGSAENQVQTEKHADFGGWDAWKERNRQGFDCAVTIRRERNRITMHTENLGIAIYSVTTIRDAAQDVYVALTGDQCAITDIHIEEADA